MRADSSILELVDTADGAVIAAPVREIADSSCRSHLRSVAAPASRARDCSMVSGSYGPTRPQEVIAFEELLSEPITIARMLRPHLGSRLVSALLTYGVRLRTLSREERCGRM